MLDRIPVELRQLPQWVACGPDKVPICPRTRKNASVTNPRTWGTFQEAASCGLPYVGFVLTEDDPYVIVDLDNKPERPAPQRVLDWFEHIIDTADTYTELSASERGFHIIMKGTMPRGGVRNDGAHIEMYRSERFMIMTGTVVMDRPISPRQDIIDELLSGMTDALDAGDIELEDVDPTISDAEVFERASEAENGDRFLALWNDEDWQRRLPHLHEDNSRADDSLIEYLCYYTDSNDQVYRMFMGCPLAQREKVQRRGAEYVYRSIRRARRFITRERAEQEDIERARMEAVRDMVLEEPQPKPSPVAITRKPAPSPAVTYPPGLVGEIAEYVYSSAQRPVPEVGLAIAIALFAGITGRTYHVSGSGLHQYLVLVAETGVGKEGGRAGLDRLINAVAMTIPDAGRFVGPANYASGQALIKALDEQPCYVSLLGEFGHLVNQLADPRAPAHLKTLERCLLDLYSLSGPQRILRSSVYSDKEKNTKAVRAPNLTILGDTTPEELYGNLSQAQITSGLLPRFSIIEYKGNRPRRNPRAEHDPHPDLVERLGEVMLTCLTAQTNGTSQPVHMDGPAKTILDAFDIECDDTINGNRHNGVVVALWNRAHLKALKLAALVAVGRDPQNPTINAQDAQWALNFVRREIRGLEAKFENEEVGKGEVRAESDVRRAIEDYRHLTPHQRISSYKVAQSLSEFDDLIPFTYLRRRLKPLQAFRDHRAGAGRAIELILTELETAEVIYKMPRRTALEKYKCTSPVYTKGSAW